jgi:flagellar M-ring protein FliF
MAEKTGLAGMWNSLSSVARIALATGVLIVGGILAAASIWSMQTDYRILFSNLSEPDAASIVTELKRAKTPFRLTDGGTTIKVPAERVYETRLALMSSGAPLSGGVGFEIFDKQGLGATEQSQRVSYQRALQGELARTIGALDHVRQARVLLALPESSLFRRDRQEARAAVSLIMQPGPPLAREQIAGIQRLVAASVTDLDPARVVVTDQRGVTLSGSDALTGPGGIGSGRLAMKRDIEEYFTRKIADLLESAYGPGQVIVSVDVALNFDEIHRTVQNLLPAATANAPEAGVHRKRQVITGLSGSGETMVPDAEAGGSHPSSSSTDVEYEYGRRVEQVVASPGSIEQMSVGVVVRGDLNPEKQARIAQLVRMAAGLNEKRGDAISVQPLDAADVRTAVAPTPVNGTGEISPPMATPARASEIPTKTLWAEGLLATFVLAIAGLLFMRRPRSTRLLSADERAQLLQELQQNFAMPPTNASRRAP